MPNFKTSDHLKAYRSFNVEIYITDGNTTAYLIKQTQGAEYGDEAEAVRAIFESALNKAFGKNTPIEAECSYCNWKGSKDEMEAAEDDDDVDKCPICGSENVYYL